MLESGTGSAARGGHPAAARRSSWTGAAEGPQGAWQSLMYAPHCSFEEALGSSALGSRCFAVGDRLKGTEGSSSNRGGRYGVQVLHVGDGPQQGTAAL